MKRPRSLVWPATEERPARRLRDSNLSLDGASRRRASCVLLIVAVLSASGGSATPRQPLDEESLPLSGRPLVEVLAELVERGLKLVYTTELVPPDLIVGREPEAEELHRIAAEILRPHGLAIEPGPGDTLVVVRSPPARTEPTRRLVVEPDVELGSGMVFEEELTVTPSRISMLRDTPVSPLALARQQILSLPHLGDDLYRALSLMPGVVSNDVTAQFHVRGGRRDETRILLDGQELFDAYHLKDFDSALSLVSSTTLGSADLTTGGFAVEHGDRMSAVLDMRTIRPSGGPRGHVGVGVLAARAGGSGLFHRGRGAWLAEARRGTIDLASQLLGSEDPDYWDAYGKLEYQLDQRNGLRGHLLLSGDELRFSEIDGPDSKRTLTDYDSGYAWLVHELLATDRLLVESAASLARIDRDRSGFALEEDVAFSVRDLRAGDVTEVRQGWTLQTSDHLIRWGFELRRFDTEYDYLADFAFDNPLAEIRQLPDDEPNVFRRDFDERHDGLYLADRLIVSEHVSLDAGLRYDEHSQTDERLLSPRLNLALAPGERSVVRLAWGRFNQSQRPYELQVEDGETLFHPVERSSHALVGYERIVERPTGQLALRAEIYRREVSNPRPRYENLFEALNTFPELEPDRVRVAPDETVIEGVEMFVRGPAGPRVAWWVNYTWAEARDEIGGRSVWRAFDQRHTLNLDLDLRLGERWRLNLAWRFHTGWPTTPLSTEAVSGEEGEIEFVPRLGPLYSRRLPDYHRLDLRARREWQLHRSLLTLSVDIQNVYDRDNVAGFDVQIDEETGAVTLEREDWAGILPSVGLTLEF